MSCRTLSRGAFKGAPTATYKELGAALRYIKESCFLEDKQKISAVRKMQITSLFYAYICTLVEEKGHWRIKICIEIDSLHVIFKMND